MLSFLKVSETPNLVEDPSEIVFEEGVSNMNEFLDRVNQFERITNERMTDLWRIKDLAF
jgi:hypothetical protein